MSRDLLFEIGTEELPAIPLYSAAKAFERSLIDGLEASRLEHGECKLYFSPRRIAALVEGVGEETLAQEDRMRGPSAQIAFEGGEPTKAARGFARGKGVGVEDLIIEEEDGKKYVFAVVKKASEPAQGALAELLSRVPSQIPWPKSQRWEATRAAFARPVRWLVALFGDEVIPAKFAGVGAGRSTRGHRLLADREIPIESAAGYEAAMQQGLVVASAEERERIIREGIAAMEAKTGLVARVPKGTFEEVVNLVEYPTVMLGSFDERFLEVPSEIITEAMLKHQRYFPMYTQDGKLANSFIITSNADPACEATVVAGNERVVRARLDDAEFFYEEDLKKPLEAYVPQLEKVVFQERLGSVLGKTKRMQAVVHAMCESEQIAADLRESAERASLLAKADLVTSAVVEFPTQQGVMGGYYALAQGESQMTAEAIADHYRPRFAGDDLPRSDAGKLVALADKLDTICGIFAIGQAPTGSSDPYALRRGAIGIVNILLDGLGVSLAGAIDASIASYIGEIDFDEDAVRDGVASFFKGRMAVMMRDDCIEPDVVDAVLATGSLEPSGAFSRARALSQARTTSPQLFSDLSVAYARAANLSDPALGADVDPSQLTAPEKSLLDALIAAEGELDSAQAAKDPAAALTSLSKLRAPIDEFFEQVLVMDDDEAVRDRHLRLLNRFVGAFTGIALLDKLEG